MNSIKIIQKQSYKLSSAYLVLCIFLLLNPIYSISNELNIKDSIYVQKLLAKAKVQAEVYPDNAIQLMNEVLRMPRAKSNSSEIMIAYSILGNAYKNKGDYPTSIRFYKKGIDLAVQKQDLKMQGILLYNSAGAYERLGDFGKAMEITISALELKRKIGDKDGIGRCYRQIAECMSMKGDNYASIFYFDKAIAMQRKIGNLKSLTSCLINKSVVLTDLGKYKRAISVLHEAELISSKNNDSTNLVSLYLNTGYCYHSLNQIDSAVFYYEKSLGITDRFQDFQNQLIIYNNLGSLYLESGQLIAAESNLKKGNILAEELSSLIDLKDISGNLSILYFKKGDYKNAYLQKEKFSIYSDSLLNGERIRTTEEITTKFKTKEIESQNKLLIKKNELQHAQAKQKNYLLGGIVTLTLLISTILILFNRKNKYKTQKESLEVEQQLLQLQMNPHFIFNSLQSIQSFILTNNTEKSANYLTSFSRLIRLILENSKKDFISLEKEIVTIKYYLELQRLRFSGSFNYEISIGETIHQDFLSIPPMLLQPFLENSIEHGFRNNGDENKIHIRFEEENNHLKIILEDNGIGIFKSKKNKNREGHHSLAIFIIKKRIELINQKLGQSVTLNIEDLSEIDNLIQGTRITLLMPLKTN